MSRNMAPKLATLSIRIAALIIVKRGWKYADEILNFKQLYNLIKNTPGGVNVLIKYTDYIVWVRRVCGSSRVF